MSTSIARPAPALHTASLLLASLLALLTACDSPSSAAPESAAAIGTFDAVVSGPQGAVSIAGSVELSQNNDEADFTGAFQAYPVARGRDGTSFTFTMIRLRTGNGDELLLGHIAPSADLPDGLYGIEPGRDLRPPYEFVARYRERTAAGRQQIAARDGSVRITADAARLSGSVELELADGRTITGTFAAAKRP